MISPRVVGTILLVLGVVLIVIGVRASNSFADQVSELFRGRMTDSTMWYIIIGLAATIAGLGLTFAGRGGGRGRAA